MKTETLDLWVAQADAICITTNGHVKANGQAVMGRGTAKGASQRFYGIQTLLGTKISKRGNRVHRLTRTKEEIPYLKLPRKHEKLVVGVPWHIVSFPVKVHWKDKADLKLIKASCIQLKKLVDKMGWERVLLPRPGCGNGQLKWKQVKPVVKDILGYDDRIVVVTNGSEEEK